MPIILLTAQDLITAKVQGLDAGADDYIVKPFDINELMARMRALLRRSSNHPLPLLSWENLLLDPSTYEVTYNGQQLNLTTKEYDLLELFLRDTYHVFSSDEIIDRLWSSDDFPAEATVRSHLRRLRHKLQIAGAPADAIATIHGRGYCLKLPQSDPNVDILAIPSEPVNLTARSSELAQQQAQYREFLQQTWVTTKPQCLESLAEIGVTIDRLLSSNCQDTQRESAHQQAHKLVGTLGVFGSISAMEIARQIEKLLDRASGFTPPETATLVTLITELSAAIEQHESSPPNHDVSADRPLFLFIDLESHLTSSLTDLAAQNQIQTLVFANIDAADRYLATTPQPPSDLLASTIVFISLAGASSPLLKSIDRLHQRFPHWTILVLAQRDNLTDRLAVMRAGGKFLATVGLTTLQIFTAATSLIQPVTTPAKVMVVDDDLNWLRAIPQLLQPWGLKVTTLADPHQFWTVIKLVRPDALILDLNMPDINGLELCQVLRSDPFWQRLPILFLSAVNDAIAQQEAFSVGADDYLCKPMMGSEIAWRIRHRLARLQAF